MDFNIATALFFAAEGKGKELDFDKFKAESKELQKALEIFEKKKEVKVDLKKLKEESKQANSFDFGLLTKELP